MAKQITIVGGGLAGLTLGIGLRQRAIPVTIVEAGHYPRHRVCGEFISGKGQASLARLGLLDDLLRSGALPASTSAFFDLTQRIRTQSLPQAALCISRHFLDQSLAREFERLGGELQVGKRWVGKFGEGVVRAAGRRLEAVPQGWRWFGLKVHARNVVMETDLEMHLTPAGYVGLCKLPGDEVNVCGLFRTATPIPELAHRWREWLTGSNGSALRSRLAEAQFDLDSFCTVAGLGLGPHQASEHLEWCIGDALTMIPPISGNGMSMAFESAELALQPLVKFSTGDSDWKQAQQHFSTTADKAFRSRLRWASRLQSTIFSTPGRWILLTLLRRSGSLGRTLFRHTR